MDVGYFINELLAQHGEVNVPGLGYFAHTRVNGYYNEAEDKFYPPSYSVHFNQQTVDDEDALAQYIAERKNISLASSKYFTEKYLTNIKLQAGISEAKFADMGWFYTEKSQLMFRPNTGISSDPEFFGYPAVSLHKLGKQPATPPVHVTEIPEAAEKEQLIEVHGQQFATEEEHEAYIIAYTAKRRRKVIWTFVLLAIAFAGVILILLYKFDPADLGINQLAEKETPKAAPLPKANVVPVKKDTIIQVGADTLYSPEKLPGDTITKNGTNLTDSIPFPRYEIMGGAFKDNAAAQIAIADYKKRGVKASIAEFVPGPRVHVTLGTFKTKAEAEKAMAELKKNKKIKEEIYPQKINGK
jgi:hypothetical protein